jgi:hypothetical protein
MPKAVPSQNFLNHVFSVNGDGALRNANKPNKSSTPFETGVPVTHHRCFPGSNAAICAHAAVDDSTSCASSERICQSCMGKQTVY